MSKIYSLKKVQLISADIDTVWDFFTIADNLKNITPEDLGFKITGRHHGDQIYAWQIIEYTVKPLFGISLYWMTEITHMQHKKYFIDEQRFGPYSLWHHQHHFKETENGVEMTDIVHYKIPFWFIGDIANSLLIKNELKKIFDYRFNMVEEKFRR